MDCWLLLAVPMATMYAHGKMRSLVDVYAGPIKLEEMNGWGWMRTKVPLVEQRKESTQTNQKESEFSWLLRAVLFFIVYVHWIMEENLDYYPYPYRWFPLLYIVGSSFVLFIQFHFGYHITGVCKENGDDLRAASFVQPPQLHKKLRIINAVAITTTTLGNRNYIVLWLEWLEMLFCKIVTITNNEWHYTLLRFWPTSFFSLLIVSCRLAISFVTVFLLSITFFVFPLATFPIL